MQQRKVAVPVGGSRDRRSMLQPTPFAMQQHQQHQQQQQQHQQQQHQHQQQLHHQHQQHHEQQQHPHHHQQQQTYHPANANANAMGMTLGMNMTMNMTDMQSSIRSFHPQSHLQHQQQHQQQVMGADGAPVPYWRPALMDTQYRGGGAGLDLEFNDFLGRDQQGGAPSPANANGDVTMADSAMQSFQVSTAFGAMNALPASSSAAAMGSGASVGSQVAPLHLQAPLAGHLLQRGAMNQHQQQHPHHQQASPSAAVTSPGSDGSMSARVMSLGGRMAPHPLAHQLPHQLPHQHQHPHQRQPSPGAPSPNANTTTNNAHTNTNTTNTTNANATNANATGGGDYSRFVDSTDEPDLSQHKIEQKNEKCQYHSCPNRARVAQAYGKFCNRHVIVAPCGFPGCRDKALSHSSMCDKHLAEGKESLHRILATRAQNVPVCRTFGCFKNDQGRGYCRGHEKLLMATGRLPKHINKRRLNSAYTMCAYPTCNKHSQRNHLCRTHGNAVMKQAEEIARQSSSETFEDVLARLQKEIRRCTHPTCTKNSQRDRLCTMHYYEKHNLPRDANLKEAEAQHAAARAAAEASGSGSASGSGIGNGNGKKVSTKGGGGGKAMTAKMAGTDGVGSATRCGAQNCAQRVHVRGFCKYHASVGSAGATTTASASPLAGEGMEGIESGPSSTSSASASASASAGVPPRNHPLCGIPGCGEVSPYASGLCAHHGNKANQAMHITRGHGALGASVDSSPPTTEGMSCQVSSCGSPALPGGALCEPHRRMFGTTTNDSNSNANNEGGEGMASTRPSLDPGFYGGNASGSGGGGFVGNEMDARYGGNLSSGGATTRMANLSVATGMDHAAASAENEARQALCNLNTQGKSSTGGNPTNSNSNNNNNNNNHQLTCSNPMCSRDSYGRELCESCQGMLFAPLVVSVGDGPNGNAYPFSMNSGADANATATAGAQAAAMAQPEPESESNPHGWEEVTQGKAPAKGVEQCRIQDCHGALADGGLCASHLHAFRTGALSVDQIALRSRQLAEDRERERAGNTSGGGDGDEKPMTSPKVKKYFCKVETCDKQAQKKGLCKRHFRLQEAGGGTPTAAGAKSDARNSKQSNNNNGNNSSNTVETGAETPRPQAS